ncbi:MAG TPA: Pycsar system effector family protein [Salinimicrobium sp.]|nr:Pycsar system effector family protein [Salinimicrobium sp.]
MSVLLEKVEQFVEQLFNEKLPSTFLYHNHKHTKRVIKSTKEIIEKSQINVKQEETVLLAAWFHDVGYIHTYKGHEEESIKIATTFLKEENVAQEIIDEVISCIKATKMGVEPKTELQKILKDADSSHFAKEHFEKTSELLRQELKLNHIKSYDPIEWVEENIKFLTHEHKFYTHYAIQNWRATKEENLFSLLEKKNKKKKKYTEEKIKAKLKAKYKNDNPERSIQTMYRVTMRNHLKLSDIADTKANILLSVNAIIISLAMANIIPQLETMTNKYILVPSIILILFSVASIILSIMSTRPNVTSGEFTKEQVKNRDVNILFFGNFHKMPYEQYEWAMNEIINDKQYVYNSLTKDLYYLGVVLNRKYKLLRITYTTFMIGIILSVTSFGIAYFLM